MLKDLKIALDKAREKEQSASNDIKKLGNQINNLIKETKKELVNGRVSIEFTSRGRVEINDTFSQISLLPIEALSLLAWLRQQEIELSELSTLK